MGGAWDRKERYLNALSLTVLILGRIRIVTVAILSPNFAVQIMDRMFTPSVNRGLAASINGSILGEVATDFSATNFIDPSFAIGVWHRMDFGFSCHNEYS